MERCGVEAKATPHYFVLTRSAPPRIGWFLLRPGSGGTARGLKSPEEGAKYLLSRPVSCGKHVLARVHQLDSTRVERQGSGSGLGVSPWIPVQWGRWGARSCISQAPWLLISPSWLAGTSTFPFTGSSSLPMVGLEDLSQRGMLPQTTVSSRSFLTCFRYPLHHSNTQC
jgi:hypothetical protein